MKSQLPKEQIYGLLFVLASIGCTRGVPLSLPLVTQPSAWLIDSLGSDGTTSASFVAATRNAYSSVTVDAGSGFVPSNFCGGSTILGISGGAGCPASSAFRDVGATQLTQVAERVTYAGAVLPTSGGYIYRDVPELLKDDDGIFNADGGCAADCTTVVALTAAQHAGMVSCGTTQSTIETRISDCATLNPGVSTWNGATSSTGGQAVWKLVTQSAANVEVWQDQRTGLLWSSKAGANSNWCEASGNNDPADPSATCIGNAVSYCAETMGPSAVLPTTGFPGDNFGVSPRTYDTAKGAMGQDSTPSVRWRLPTADDYKQADIDGIRSVMPDMGAFSAGTEWTATVFSATRANAWHFDAGVGSALANAVRTGNRGIRCVGRGI